MGIRYTLAALIVFVMVGASSVAFAGDDGLVTKKSAYSVKETLDRLENILKKKGITVATTVTKWEFH